MTGHMITSRGWLPKMLTSFQAIRSLNFSRRYNKTIYMIKLSNLVPSVRYFDPIMDWFTSPPSSPHSDRRGFNEDKVSIGRGTCLRKWRKVDRSLYVEMPNTIPVRRHYPETSFIWKLVTCSNRSYSRSLFTFWTSLSAMTIRTKTTTTRERSNSSALKRWWHLRSSALRCSWQVRREQSYNTFDVFFCRGMFLWRRTSVG